MNKNASKQQVVKTDKVFNFKFNAGEAKPNIKAIASALAPAKVKLMDFCNQVNNDTKILEYKGKAVQVVVTVAPDGTFKYICKGRPSTNLIKEAAGIEKGSKNTGHEECGTVTEEQLMAIAETKQEYLSGGRDQWVKILKGTAKSMGVKVVS